VPFGVTAFQFIAPQVADDLGVEHVGGERSLGGELVFKDVELARIAGAQDDAAALAVEHALDLTMIETGEFGLLLRDFIDFEELTLHAGADDEPAMMRNSARTMILSRKSSRTVRRD